VRFGLFFDGYVVFFIVCCSQWSMVFNKNKERRAEQNEKSKNLKMRELSQYFNYFWRGGIKRYFINH
jgi:hypothetical protein